MSYTPRNEKAKSSAILVSQCEERNNLAKLHLVSVVVVVVFQTLPAYHVVFPSALVKGSWFESHDSDWPERSASREEHTRSNVASGGHPVYKETRVDLPKTAHGLSGPRDLGEELYEFETDQDEEKCSSSLMQINVKRDGS